MKYEVIDKSELGEYQDRTYGSDFIKVSRNDLVTVLNHKGYLYIPVADKEYSVIIECTDTRAECHKKIDRLSDEAKYAFMNLDVEKLEKFLVRRSRQA